MPFDQLKRRQFITLLGGAAAWPLAARAQQTERVRRIGLLSGFSESEMQPLLIALRQSLKALGWVKCHNIAVDIRLSGGDLHRMAEDADSLIELSPDVILVQGTPGLAAARQRSLTVPVVVVLVAPAKTIIENLGRPGGYTTGRTNFDLLIAGKWLELLRELAPHVSHVTVLSEPGNPANRQYDQYLEEEGRSVGIDINTAAVNNPAEIEGAIAVSGQRPGGGLLILRDRVTERKLIIDLAAHYRLPAMYPFPSSLGVAGLLVMASTFLNSTATLQTTLTASSEERSQAIYRCRHPPSLIWLST